VVKNKPFNEKLDDSRINLADKLIDKLKRIETSQRFDILIILHDFEIDNFISKCIENIKKKFSSIKFAVISYKKRWHQSLVQNYDLKVLFQDFDGSSNLLKDISIERIKEEIVYLKWRDDSSKLVINMGRDDSFLNSFITIRTSNSDILKKKEIIFEKCMIKNEKDFERVFNDNIDKFLENISKINCSKELYFLKRNFFKNYEEYKQEKYYDKFKDNYDKLLNIGFWLEIQELHFKNRGQTNKYWLYFDQITEPIRNFYLGSANLSKRLSNYLCWIEIFNDKESMHRIIDIHLTAETFIKQFENDFRKKIDKCQNIDIPKIGFGDYHDISFLVYFSNLDLNYSALKNPDEQTEEVIQALAHYSYNVSNGELIVFDIRPITNQNSILITEPIIYSKDSNKFASSNLGLKGIKNFMDEHKCNSICKKMEFVKFN